MRRVPPPARSGLAGSGRPALSPLQRCTRVRPSQGRNRVHRVVRPPAEPQHPCRRRSRGRSDLDRCQANETRSAPDACERGPGLPSAGAGATGGDLGSSGHRCAPADAKRGVRHGRLQMRRAPRHPGTALTIEGIVSVLLPPENLQKRFEEYESVAVRSAAPIRLITHWRSKSRMCWGSPLRSRAAIDWLSSRSRVNDRLAVSMTVRAVSRMASVRRRPRLRRRRRSVPVLPWRRGDHRRSR